jgi:hypothetical protein
MHASPNVLLGCTDCHGGNPTPGLPMPKAHVAPRNPRFWESSANPSDSNVLLNHESPEFIRFVNPADLRVAQESCGLCHGKIIEHVGHSMMNHGAMLWSAALYNNGAVPFKNARYGQAYGIDGAPLRLESPIPVTPEMTRRHGVLPFLTPLPRFEVGQPSNILRLFEQGGERPTEIGNPNPFEQPGRPARRTSPRGLGTLNRVDPVFLNLQKTRLHDPLLGFMGTNDHPGDYRSSGCAACHVVYANDREAREGAPNPAPVLAQHPVEPVHELPHASGKPLRESVPRVHVVGSGERREVHVPGAAEESDRGRARRLAATQPRGRRRARALE